MKIKDALYDSLTPDQRIHATLAALARDDMKEADRLADTCPEHTYRMKDSAYIMRLHVTCPP